MSTFLNPVTFFNVIFSEVCISQNLFSKNLIKSSANYFNVLLISRQESFIKESIKFLANFIFVRPLRMPLIVDTKKWKELFSPFLESKDFLLIGKTK